MYNLQLVTIALGESVTINPHPSGLPLPPLRLGGGDTMRVSPEEASKFYQASKTLGTNGQPRPRPLVTDDRPRIHRGYAPVSMAEHDVIDIGGDAIGNAAALEEYDRQREADKAAPGMAAAIPRRTF
jgi:hypothetical protein